MKESKGGIRITNPHKEMLQAADIYGDCHSFEREEGRNSIGFVLLRSEENDICSSISAAVVDEASKFGALQC